MASRLCLARRWVTRAGAALGACCLLVLAYIPAQPACAQGAPQALSAPQLAQGARGALDALLAAYTSGQTQQAEMMLDIAMIGRQVLADQMRVSLAQHSQMRMTLRDAQSTVGDDVVLLSVNWEKRFLLLPAQSPGLRTGHAVFMWQRGRDGWRLIGLSGDSPFAP